MLTLPVPKSVGPGGSILFEAFGEKPKNKENGDISSNIAFLLSKELKQNPMDIANKLKNILNKSDLFQAVEVASPGFINFRFNVKPIVKNINKIIKLDTNYGKNNSGENKKVLVEFVSANPTGPLTVGHGRGAIIGDTISNILLWNGYDVFLIGIQKNVK